MTGTRMLFFAGCVAFCLVAGTVRGEDIPADPGVDQEAVDAAVEKGVEWLLTHYGKGIHCEMNYAELVLLALIHGGAPEGHPVIVEQFNRVMKKKLMKTYNDGLRGLILEKVNRKAYQTHLAHIACHFAANQCENGQWNYSGRTKALPPVRYQPVKTKRAGMIPSRKTVAATRDDIPDREIKVPPVETLGGNPFSPGDNSNSQYAIMGLFAASRASVVVPEETWKKVVAWFEKVQNTDGGWGYDSGGKPSGNSLGSMTVAGLTGLIVAEYYLGNDWKESEAVQKGLGWLGRNFTVQNNPRGDPRWHYYFLYGMERVGVVSGLESFGNHRWYREGAEYLLRVQKGDGSWSGKEGDGIRQVEETCFAILFLKRGTPKLEKPEVKPKDPADVETGKLRDVATGRTKDEDKEKEEDKDDKEEE